MIVFGRIFLLVLAILSETAFAGETRCNDFLEKTGLADSIPSYADLVGKCITLRFEGQIEPGDTERLRDELRGWAVVDTIMISSPGGDVAEAIAMGRLIRSLFMRVHAFDHCASACVLVLAGGVGRSWDEIHVHRPALKDMGVIDYATARERVAKVERVIADYLREMEASTQLFQLMMDTPSTTSRLVKKKDWRTDDSILSYHPRSVEEWLTARCLTAGFKPSDEVLQQVQFSNCQFSERHVEFRRKSAEREANWKAERAEVNKRWAVAARDCGWLSHHLSDDLDKSISACSRHIDDAAQNLDSRVRARARRAELYLLKKDYDRAIADFSEALKLADPALEAGSHFYIPRAAAYEAAGKHDSAIQDYRKALEILPDGATWAAWRLEAAEGLQRLGASSSEELLRRGAKPAIP